MNESDLNLARKWRSKNFDQVIGQELSVRIIKNSLYLNSFFPVYLFSGQRGCGKTTMARLFACAINCDELINFQKDPKKFSIPCLRCVSCISMQNFKHPDFIEIDAASHTGVDNVRQIVEAASLLPLMGKKKIYLIDEAHMLSKAAFNAFLKILEEPPKSVVFILATTDVQKIIETVRSRCFQLFFSSISIETLFSHLKNICDEENINYDLDALKLIANESGGSVRDAINLLEQIRFADSKITKDVVLRSLGHLSDENLLIFFDHLINDNDCQKFLLFLEEINFYFLSAELIFNKLIEILRCVIRLKYGISPKIFLEQQISLNKIIANCSLDKIIHVLNEFCKNELLFNKSINKNLFLELLCLRIISVKNNSNKITLSETKKESALQEIPNKKLENSKELFEINLDKKNDLWGSFLVELKNINDPILNSIFSQANFVHYSNDKFEVSIEFSNSVIFYKDLIDDKINVWLPILKKIFHLNASLNISFDKKDSNIKHENNNINIKENRKFNINLVKKIEIKKEDHFDITDKEKWKFANSLVENFPGIITEIKEEINE